MTTQSYDDDDLERLVRAGLAHHAQDAPTHLAGTVPGTGGAGTLRPRRGRRWLLPAAAAVVALAIPVGYLLAREGGAEAPGTPVAGGSSRSGPPSSPSSSSASSAIDSAPSGDPGARTAGATAARPDGIPAQWRAESYRGVQVWVPPDWGWGGAPFAPAWEPGKIMDCGGLRAMTVPGSSDFEFVPDGLPYAGRPAMMSDACEISPTGHPAADAVWLGAAGIEPGTQAYDDGVVRESRAVGDVVVTVFSTDAALRQQILDSARQVDVDANGCPATAPDPVGDSTWTKESAPNSLSVCVYADDGLLWSGSVGEKQARAYAAAAGPGAAGAHPGRPVDWVGEGHIYLGLRSLGAADDHRVRWDRYSPVIGILSPDGQGGTVMTPAAVANTAPWAKDSGGVKAYIVGGGADLDPGLQRFFRGILG